MGSNLSKKQYVFAFLYSAIFPLAAQYDMQLTLSGQTPDHRLLMTFISALITFPFLPIGFFGGAFIAKNVFGGSEFMSISIYFCILLQVVLLIYLLNFLKIYLFNRKKNKSSDDDKLYNNQHNPDEQLNRIKTPPKKNKRTLFLFIMMIVFIIMFILYKSYLNKQQNTKYEAQDTIERLSAPDFNTDLLSLGKIEQFEMIKTYRLQGFNLRCFSNLRRNEKIGKEDDYLCWAVTKNAYNIPAKLMTVFFSKKKLTHVRLEFPTSSFESIQNYMKTLMKGRPDLSPLSDMENPDSPLKWKVDNGIVAVNRYKERKIIVLWSSKNTLSPEGQIEFDEISSNEQTLIGSTIGKSVKKMGRDIVKGDTWHKN